MAVNQFRQRLMAAGASPARATQMVGQKAFEAGAPATLGKPQGPNEWYNDSYASASESLYSGGFRPPTVDAPEFKQYYDVVYGTGAYDKFTNRALSKAFATKAPTYNVASKAAVNSFERFVADGIGSGLFTPEELIDTLMNPALQPKFKDNPDSQNLINLARGARTRSDVTSYVYKIFNEYSDAKSSLLDIYDKEIQKNRDYRYGLPDPKLRYGVTTSLGEGSIDILTNPTAAKAYAAYKQRTNDPAKLSAFKVYLVNEANKRQITPWKDEARRRDSLKGKKIGG